MSRSRTKRSRLAHLAVGAAILAPALLSSCMAARPMFGREWVRGEYGEVLENNWRAEMTVYHFAFSRADIRVGSGFGWISYPLNDECVVRRSMNSARGHFVAAVPINLSSGIRLYLEPRFTVTRLRKEKSEERTAFSSGGNVAERPGCEEIQRRRAWGGEGVIGLEGPIPWGWLRGFNWSVAAHYGAFGSRRVELYDGAPLVNNARTWGA